MAEGVAERGEVDFLCVSGVCGCDDIYGHEVGVAECVERPSDVRVVRSDQLVGLGAVLLVCVTEGSGLYWRGGGGGGGGGGGRERRGRIV